MVEFKFYLLAFSRLLSFLLPQRKLELKNPCFDKNRTHDFRTRLFNTVVDTYVCEVTTININSSLDHSGDDYKQSLYVKGKES